MTKDRSAKRAARERAKEIGEPYALARRRTIEQHRTSPVEGPDPRSWTLLLESLQDESDLPTQVRVRAIAGVHTLERLLGSDWLASVSLDHPIVCLFWNKAEWTRVRLADLADALISIRRLGGSPRLIAKLTDENQASSALLEIETVVRVQQHGLSVQLEPKTTGDKHCDLVISSSTSERLFVEITAVAPISTLARQQEMMLNRIFPSMEIIVRDHVGGGQLVAWPEASEAPALIEAADRFWQGALVSDVRETLNIPGVLQLWSVPMRPDGPGTNFRAPLHEDPLARTRRAVRNKIAQLPADAPGVIVVRAPSHLWMMPSLAAIGQTVQDAVLPCPQVVAAILTSWGYSSDRTERRLSVSDEAELVQSPDRHIFTRTSLVVWNAQRATRAMDGLVDVLVRNPRRDAEAGNVFGRLNGHEEPV
jgi:hypothetical protein